jgi:hypothetical protein
MRKRFETGTIKFFLYTVMYVDCRGTVCRAHFFPGAVLLFMSQLTLEFAENSADKCTGQACALKETVSLNWWGVKGLCVYHESLTIVLGKTHILKGSQA